MPYKGKVNDGNAEHQEPQTDTYDADQKRQRLARERERLQLHQDRKQEFSGKATVEIDGKSFKHEDAQWEPDELKFTINRTGKELTPEEHLVLLAERKKRIRYLRSDGSWERLRERPTVRVQNPETKKWEKVRIETPENKISGLRYEAFLIRPDLSAALVLACLNGFGELAKKLAQELDRACLREFERFTGFEAVAGPLHPKLFAGHFQVSSNRISQAGRLLAEADLPHLGRKMMGAWTLSTVFGITGKKLDELTGHEDAQVGIDEALANRGDRAVDFHMYKFIAKRFEMKLREARFKALVPFASMGRNLVLQFQDKLLDFLRDPDEKIIEAGKRGRDEGRQAARAEIAKEKAAYNKELTDQSEQLASLRDEVRCSADSVSIARKQTESALDTANGYFQEVSTLVTGGLRTVLAFLNKAQRGERIGEEAAGFIYFDQQTGLALVDASWVKRAEEFVYEKTAAEVLRLHHDAVVKNGAMTSAKSIEVPEPEQLPLLPISTGFFDDQCRLHPVLKEHYLPAEVERLAKAGLLRSPRKQEDETSKLLPVPPAPKPSMFPGPLPKTVPTVTVPQVDVRPNPAITAKPKQAPTSVTAIDDPPHTFQVLQGTLDALELKHKGGELSSEQERHLRIDDGVAGGRVLSESAADVLSRCRSSFLYEALAEKIDQRLEVAEAGRQLFDIYNELTAARRREDGDRLPDFKFLNPDGSMPRYVQEAIHLTLREVSFYGSARLPDAVKYRVNFARRIFAEIDFSAPVVGIEQTARPSQSRPELKMPR